jgi:hypothetical protein
VVVLDDLAGCVELPEVTVIGERVVLAMDRNLETISTKTLSPSSKSVCGSKRMILSGARDSKNPTTFAFPRRG